MKKIEIKSLMLGILIGSLSIGAVSAATLGIKSANYNETKVIYNGQELKLSQPMMTVINQYATYGSNYMPIRAVLEAMNYKVDWDGKLNAVIVNDTIKAGEVVIDDGSNTNIVQNPILLKYSDFFGNFDFILTKSDNVFCWEYFYNGSLSIEKLREKLNKSENFDFMIKEIFTSLTKEVDGGMLYIYYDKAGLNTLISAVYSKNDTNISYDFSGMN